MTRSQWISFFAPICCITLLFSANASADDSTFTVTSFIPKKFVDFQWLLKANLHMQGASTGDSGRTFYEVESINRTSSEDFQNISITSDQYYRHETIPRYFFYRLVTSFDYHNENDNNIDCEGHVHNDRSMPRINFATEYGSYLYSDLFISIAGAGYWSFSHESNNPYYGTREERNYGVDLSLRSGWGRLYNGRFAATALYMIKELKSKTFLSRDLTYQELQHITELIYRYRMTHAIDNRLHRIEALQKIFDELTQTGALPNVGPYGYLLIQDVWDYFPNYSRSFGFKTSVGVGCAANNSYPQFSIVNSGQQTLEYGHTTNIQRLPYLILNSQYSLPLGLRWQIDLSGYYKYYFATFVKSDSHFYYYLQGRSDHIIESTNYWAYYDFNISGTLRYIYDSRTSMAVNAFCQIGNQDALGAMQIYANGDLMESDLGRGDRYDRQIGLGLFVEYRISIPTMLYVNLTGIDMRERSAMSMGFGVHNVRQYDLSVGISHYLY